MFGFLNLFGCVCPHLHPTIIAINDLFFSDFFPVILTFLRQLPFVGQFLNLHQTCMPTILCFLPEASHAHSRDGHVPPQLLDRLAGSRTSSVTDTTPISYYWGLSDSTAAPVVVNAGFYWIWNSRFDSNKTQNTSRLTPDNLFDVI